MWKSELPGKKAVHGLNGTQQASQCGVTVPLLGTPQPQALMAQHGPLAQMETPIMPFWRKNTTRCNETENQQKIRSHRETPNT